jgi:hypothetical protein
MLGQRSGADGATADRARDKSARARPALAGSCDAHGDSLDGCVAPRPLMTVAVVSHGAWIGDVCRVVKPFVTKASELMPAANAAEEVAELSTGQSV